MMENLYREYRGGSKILKERPITGFSKSGLGQNSCQMGQDA